MGERETAPKNESGWFLTPELSDRQEQLIAQNQDSFGGKASMEAWQYLDRSNDAVKQTDENAPGASDNSDNLQTALLTGAGLGLAAVLWKLHKVFGPESPAPQRPDHQRKQVERQLSDTREAITSRIASADLGVSAIQEGYASEAIRTGNTASLSLLLDEFASRPDRGEAVCAKLSIKLKDQGIDSVKFTQANELTGIHSQMVITDVTGQKVVISSAYGIYAFHPEGKTEYGAEAALTLSSMTDPKQRFDRVVDRTVHEAAPIIEQMLRDPLEYWHHVEMTPKQKLESFRDGVNAILQAEESPAGKFLTRSEIESLEFISDNAKLSHGGQKIVVGNHVLEAHGLAHPDFRPSAPRAEAARQPGVNSLDAASPQRPVSEALQNFAAYAREQLGSVAIHALDSRPSADVGELLETYIAEHPESATELKPYIEAHHPGPEGASSATVINDLIKDRPANRSLAGSSPRAAGSELSTAAGINTSRAAERTPGAPGTSGDAAVAYRGKQHDRTSTTVGEKSGYETYQLADGQRILLPVSMHDLTIKLDPQSKESGSKLFDERIAWSEQLGKHDVAEELRARKETWMKTENHAQRQTFLADLQREMRGLHESTGTGHERTRFAGKLLGGGGTVVALLMLADAFIPAAKASEVAQERLQPSALKNHKLESQSVFIELTNPW